MARIAELLGTPLYGYQRYVVTVALEVESDTGQWAYDEVVIRGPRRIGKTFLIGPVSAHRCASGVTDVWLTAQKRENAVRRWETVERSLVGSLLGQQLAVRRGKGDERITWARTGSTFRPFSPDDNALHGEDPDLVWVDELWSFNLSDKAAIEQGYKPTWSVKPGQAWLMSAAGTEQSDWLNLATSRGRAAVESGQQRRVAYFDFGCPDEVDGVPVDELPDDELLAVVLEHHPRRDTGLRPDYLRDELADMGRVDFLRAYGNRTAHGAQRTVVDMGAWKRAWTQVRIPPHVPVALGFDVDTDRREGAVVAAWRDPSGVALTEVVRTQSGTRWLAKYVAGIVGRQAPGVVVVNNAGPARDVADELERMGVALLRISGTDYAAACARVADELEENRPTVMHAGNKALTDAMRAAGRRRLGGGRAWERRSDEPITTFAAFTLACWGADHMPAQPGRFRIT